MLGKNKIYEYCAVFMQIVNAKGIQKRDQNTKVKVQRNERFISGYQNNKYACKDLQVKGNSELKILQ